jgi:hypothetical protein
MQLVGSLLAFVGLLTALLFSEGEFSGSAGDAARRRWLRRAGFTVALIGMGLSAWSEYA